MAKMYSFEGDVSNLKIKIALREIGNDGSNPSTIEINRVINWQEKILGPLDICNFIKANKENANRITESLQEVMLYTYIHNDEYVPKRDRILHELEDEPYTNSLSSSSNNPNTEKFSKRMKSETVSIMRICLATDVDVEALKKERPWDPTYYYHETVLATIRVTSAPSISTLEISPGFSGILEESDVDVGESAGLLNANTSKSLFLTNASVVASINKGLKLSTYHLRSKKGKDFEYTVTSQHDVVDPNELKNKLIDPPLKKDPASGWKQDPPADGFDSSIAVYAEIVSATGFDCESLFLSYQVATPTEGWTLRRGNLSDGVPEKATSTSTSAHENFADSEGMLHGTTQTAAGHVPLINRPHLDLLSRKVVATVFFVVCCFAVIMGIDYPIWLAPVLVFLFMLGSGFPAGAADNSQVTEDGRVVSSSVDVMDSHFYFNHLISLSFDRRKRDIEALGRLVASKAPTVYVQVYATGALGRAVLEGYGYFHIDEDKSTTRDLTITLWKPRSTHSAAVVEHFLGGSTLLKDNAFVSTLNALSRTINRFGVHTLPSGKVRVRYNCVVSERVPSTTRMLATASSSAKPSTVRRSVEDILQSFRASTDNPKFKSSFASVVGGMRSLGSSSLSRSSSLRESSSSLSKSDRVAEILARAKAKVRGMRGLSATIEEEESETSPLHMATLLAEVPRQNRYPSEREDEDEDEDGGDGDQHVDESSTLLKKNK